MTETTLPNLEEMLEEATPELLAKDRCDSCNAQAFVVVRMLSGSLLMFCGHDYAKHEKALQGRTQSVLDNRHTINQKPNED